MADSLEGMNEEQIRSLASFAHRHLKDPRTRQATLENEKKINPEFHSPELELESRLAKVREDEAEARKKLEDQLREQQITSARDKKALFCKEAGFDIEAVEKIMTDEKIGSYETAVKFMKAQSKPAPATPASVTRVSLPENVKDIMKNPNQWAKEQAHAAVDEIIAARRTA